MIIWFKFLWESLWFSACSPFLPPTSKVIFLLSFIYTNKYLMNRWQAQQGTAPYGTQQRVVDSGWGFMSGTQWIGPDGWGSRRRRISSPHLVCYYPSFPRFSNWLFSIRLRMTKNDPHITHHHPDGGWGLRQRENRQWMGLRAQRMGLETRLNLRLEPPFFFEALILLSQPQKNWLLGTSNSNLWFGWTLTGYVFCSVLLSYLT